MTESEFREKIEERLWIFADELDIKLLSHKKGCTQLPNLDFDACEDIEYLARSWPYGEHLGDTQEEYYLYAAKTLLLACRKEELRNLDPKILSDLLLPIGQTND